MIGQDFEKIHFSLFGLDLLEPMALITDVIMGGFSIYLAFRIYKLELKQPFYKGWMYFFLIFGIGAFSGGLGHAMYNYWGIWGKMISWISGPLSIFFIEKAMISVHTNVKTRKLLKTISVVKLILVYAVFVVILLTLNVAENNRFAFLPIAINTIFGVILSAAGLGYYYAKKFTNYYRYFIWGVLIMVPSAFLYLLKINLHPWFDKNDFSHVLMIAGILYFFLGVKKVAIFNRLITKSEI